MRSADPTQTAPAQSSAPVAEQNGNVASPPPRSRSQPVASPRRSENARPGHRAALASSARMPSQLSAPSAPPRSGTDRLHPDQLPLPQSRWSLPSPRRAAPRLRARARRAQPREVSLPLLGAACSENRTVLLPVRLPRERSKWDCGLSALDEPVWNEAEAGQLAVALISRPHPLERARLCVPIVTDAWQVCPPAPLSSSFAGRTSRRAQPALCAAPSRAHSRVSLLLSIIARDRDPTSSDVAE